MIYKLKKPVQLTESSPVVAELNFREEICAGDMRGVPMRDPMLYDDLLKIAGRLCAQPDAVISKISFEDMAEVLKITGSFMGTGQATGLTP